jgi:division protein CdvB (Snf7/Vps24/ESCRT-III family)
MGGVFSSSSKQKAAGGSISDVDRAVLDLKNARDRLSRYRSKLEKEEVQLMQRAKEAKEKGQTQRALGLLRLRRYKQQELKNVEAQLLTVLQMVNTIDSKQNEQEILAALKTGKDALQKMHQETSVEDVLELMDQVAEENEVESEINSILARVPSLSVDDETAVEAELEALQESIQAPKVDLPTVPSTKLPEQKESVPTKQEEPAKSSGRVAVAS